jgi:iron-sulfur cluster assembly protein
MLTVPFNSDIIRQHYRKSYKEKSMLTEIATQHIEVSPAAAQAVQGILAERQLEGYALRVYVAGGGCCGVNFGMALDNNIRDVDTTFDSKGIKLVVDSSSLDYLRGASIDFVNDPVQGSGFVINNPNAGHSHGEGGCACGSGGGHDHGDGGGCGCGGGSCGCSSN